MISLTVGFVTLWAAIIALWWCLVCSPHFSFTMLGVIGWCCFTFIPPAWLAFVLTAIYNYTRKIGE